MKKIILLSFLLALFTGGIMAQQAQQVQPPVKVYNPLANASADIQAAVEKATAEGKNIFVQVGGNWCPWCLRFNKMVTSTPCIDSIVNANYVVVHLNYSKENYNKALLSKYNYPQRFGFPVFLILDSKGNLMHTQDSQYLEQDKGYSEEKVKHFFQMWSPATLKEAAAKYGEQ